MFIASKNTFVQNSRQAAAEIAKVVRIWSLLTVSLSCRSNDINVNVTYVGAKVSQVRLQLIPGPC